MPDGRWERAHPATAFSMVRVVPIAACGLTIAGPILLSAAERTNAVRLLLLPIPRSVLYLTQSMSALADPWLVLAGVVVVALPAGIAAAGNTGVALLAAGAGLLLLAALIGLTQLMTSAGLPDHSRPEASRAVRLDHRGLSPDRRHAARPSCPGQRPAAAVRDRARPVRGTAAMVVEHRRHRPGGGPFRDVCQGSQIRRRSARQASPP